MGFYTITVDTEEEWDWSSGYRTDSNAVGNIAALSEFQRACDRHGASVTYFVNHSVLASPAAEVIDSLAQRPDIEIGLHIHAWNTPPLAASVEVPVRDSFLANLPREIALAKLDTVLDGFRARGLRPTSFRGGRYSTSDWMQEHLARHGVIADASILPYTTWPDEGAPDFRDRDLEPVRRDFGDGHWLWEIPLTLAFTRRPWRRWSRLYQLGERRPWRHLRLVGIAERLLVKRIWLNLEHPLGDRAERLLPVLQAAAVPCINLTLHSSSLWPGLNSYTRTDADLRRLYDRLDCLLKRIHDTTDYGPATVTEVARHLELQRHACTRH